MTTTSKYLFVIFIIIIEYLATTSIQIEPIQNSWDKANHFVAFMTLYITLAIGYKLSTKTNTLILLAYGIQIELVQSLLPHRYFSLLDIVADMVGVAIGVVIVWGIAKYIKGVI